MIMFDKEILDLYSRLWINWNPLKAREFKTFYEINYTVIGQWKKFDINVEKWFKFDGASIPWVLWLFWTPMNVQTLLAALVHDYIYRYHITSRKVADEIFNEILLRCWVWFFRRNAYYLWVRCWGWLTRHFTWEFAKKKKSLQK